MAREYKVLTMKLSPALHDALKQEAMERSTPDRVVSMKDLMVDAVLAYDRGVKARYRRLLKVPE